MSLKDIFIETAIGMNAVPAEPVGLAAIVMDMGMQANDPVTIGAATVCLAVMAGYARLTGKAFTEPAKAPAPKNG